MPQTVSPRYLDGWDECLRGGDGRGSDRGSAWRAVESRVCAPVTIGRQGGVPTFDISCVTAKLE